MILNKSVLHTLTIYHSIRQNFVPPLELEDTLALTETQIQEGIDLGSITDILELEQLIEATIKGGHLSQQLIFTQHISVGKQYSRTVSHIISFSSIAKRTKTTSVSQTLSLVDDINLPLIESELTLIQTIVGTQGQELRQELDLEQTIVNKRVWIRIISQSLVLDGTPNEYINNPNIIRVVVTPPVQASTIELSRGSLSVILPAPEFGNQEKYEQTRILRRNRGGELNIFRDSAWPDPTTISYNFTYLTQEQASQLLDFMRQTLGKQILLHDYEGNLHDVVLITPAAAIDQNGFCKFNTQLEFQEI